MQQAEDDPLSPVLDCREVPGDAERLACFDDATAALAERRSGGAFVVVRREQVEQAEREAFGLPTPSVGGLARSLGGLFTSESEPGGPRHDAVDDAEPARAGDAEAQVAEASGVRVLERDDEGEAEVVIMQIRRFDEYGYQRGSFHMTNGQVWEMTETERMRMPRSGEAEAHIRRLRTGGYVLRINGRGATTNVRRVR